MPPPDVQRGGRSRATPELKIDHRAKVIDEGVNRPSHSRRPAIVVGEPCEAIVIILDGPPVAKARPRVTRRGTAYTPIKTRQYERALGYQARAAMRGRSLIVGPCRLLVEATLAVPKSWPTRKRIDAIGGRVLPASKPDADNIAKSALDGIATIVIRDDGQVVSLTVTKAYGEQPQIRIVVEPLDARRPT